MGIWFTSDTHFGHKNIIGFSNRPFRDIDDHDGSLISNWNKVVGKRDQVYHLGDFSLCSKTRRAECFHALNGDKRFVQGNHDEGFAEFVQAWDAMTTYTKPAAWLGRMHTFKADNLRAELCHFPIESWDRMHHGAFHLHGHSHDACNSRPNARRLDVGVDTAFRLLGAYRPFEWEEIKAIMAERNPMLDAAPDHHIAKP
jgi:calcineurin-like phosphoesterase family protein